MHCFGPFGLVASAVGGSLGTWHDKAFLPILAVAMVANSMPTLLDERGLQCLRPALYMTDSSSSGVCAPPCVGICMPLRSIVDSESSPKRGNTRVTLRTSYG